MKSSYRILSNLFNFRSVVDHTDSNYFFGICAVVVESQFNFLQTPTPKKHQYADVGPVTI